MGIFGDDWIDCKANAEVDGLRDELRAAYAAMDAAGLPVADWWRMERERALRMAQKTREAVESDRVNLERLEAEQARRG